MNVASPIESIFPSVDSAVVVAVCETNEWRTGKEIADRTTRSYSTVLASLERLSVQGVVRRRVAGRTYLFQLNDQHLAAEPLRDLSRMRARLFGRMRSHVSEWDVEPVSVSVFGSAARGDGDDQSDIDVLVVKGEERAAPDDWWSACLSDFSQSITEWTGNRASVIDVWRSELSQEVLSRAVWKEIRQDAVNVFGLSIREVLRSV